MSKTEILESALRLKPEDKFQVVEGLLKSLDVPDPALDRIWAEEAVRRLEAYRRGEIGAIPAEDIFGPE